MVQKVERARGRPRGFDADEALDRAVRVFWTKGYDGATLDDLVEGTGVGRPSLYATFGDKETLFVRCLERYGQTIGAKTFDALASVADIRGALGAFLRQSVESATDERDPKGCLMCCVAPAVDDPKIRRFVADRMAQAAELVERRMADAVATGDLPPGFPVVQRARQVVDASVSFVLRARVGATREELLRDAEDMVSLVCGPAAREGHRPRRGR